MIHKFTLLFQRMNDFLPNLKISNKKRMSYSPRFSKAQGITTQSIGVQVNKDKQDVHLNISKKPREDEYFDE